MILVDSSGWLEFFTDGPLAAKYLAYLERLHEIVIPSMVIYEVYKKIKKERSEEAALLAVAQMGRGKIVALDDLLAMSAADISLKYNLAMADAVVYTAARREDAKLVTSDMRFHGLPGVILLKSK